MWKWGIEIAKECSESHFSNTVLLPSREGTWKADHLECQDTKLANHMVGKGTRICGEAPHSLE